MGGTFTQWNITQQFKKKEQLYATTWMNRKCIMLSERNQTQKTTS